MAGRFGLGIGTAAIAAATILLAQPAAAKDNSRRLLDGCEVGGTGADIAALESSHDAKTDRLTVTLRLCADAAPDATYRLHLDHAAPFLVEAGTSADCVTPADTVISRGPGGHQGAGRSRVVDQAFGARLVQVSNDGDLQAELEIWVGIAPQLGAQDFVL